MDSNLIVARVLSDPDLLMKVLKSKVDVFGPWQTQKYRNGAEIRLSAREKNLSLRVYPSIKLIEPEEYDYYIMGGVDWETLEEAKKEYEQEKLKWKKWTWVFDTCKGIERIEGYADDREEAKAAVESLAKTKGFLITLEQRYP